MSLRCLIVHIGAALLAGPVLSATSGRSRNVPSSAQKEIRGAVQPLRDIAVSLDSTANLDSRVQEDLDARIESIFSEEFADMPGLEEGASNSMRLKALSDFIEQNAAQPEILDAVSRRLADAGSQARNLPQEAGVAEALTRASSALNDHVARARALAIRAAEKLKPTTSRDVRGAPAVAVLPAEQEILDLLRKPEHRHGLSPRRIAGELSANPATTSGRLSRLRQAGLVVKTGNTQGTVYQAIGGDPVQSREEQILDFIKRHPRGPTVKEIPNEFPNLTWLMAWGSIQKLRDVERIKSYQDGRLTRYIDAEATPPASVQDRILATLAQRQYSRGASLTEITAALNATAHAKVTDNVVTKHLMALCKAGKVKKVGKARNVKYLLATAASEELGNRIVNLLKRRGPLTPTQLAAGLEAPRLRDLVGMKALLDGGEVKKYGKGRNVILYLPDQDPPLSREDRILELLAKPENRQGLSLIQICAALGFLTADSTLNKLVNQGLVEHAGKGRHVRYRYLKEQAISSHSGLVLRILRENPGLTELELASLGAGYRVIIGAVLRELIQQMIVEIEPGSSETGGMRYRIVPPIRRFLDRFIESNQSLSHDAKVWIHEQLRTDQPPWNDPDSIAEINEDRRWLTVVLKSGKRQFYMLR